jgi:hypothetical protein
MRTSDTRGGNAARSNWSTPAPVENSSSSFGNCVPRSAGATHVAVTYDDLHVKRSRILHAPEAALGFAPDWVRRQVQELNERHGASIYLSGAAEPGILTMLELPLISGKAAPALG